MDTSIAQVSAGHTEHSASQSANTMRSIAEAKRLILQNKITGVQALRILNMISAAEENISKGNAVDAQRLARTALRSVREIENESHPNPADPNRPAQSSENTPSATPSRANDETSDVHPDEETPFQRETTHYQDGSSDSGVSFQASQPLTQAQAPFAVRQHELSHIRRETSDAILNGQKIFASTIIHSRIDPESGERHVEGGRARIVVFPKVEPPKPPTGEKFDQKA